MTLSQLFGILAGLTILLAYGLYFRQMAKGQSNPNPASWLIFFIAGVINTFTYFAVVEGNIWQSLFIIMVTICLFLVLVYSLFKGKFSKIMPLEIITFILALIVGIFWQLSDNASLSNLLLQGIYLLAYIPTFMGIIRKTAKENHLAWFIDVVAYAFATMALLLNFPKDWIAFLSPVVNGMLGNSAVAILILLRNKKSQTSNQS